MGAHVSRKNEVLILQLLFTYKGTGNSIYQL